MLNRLSLTAVSTLSPAKSHVTQSSDTDGTAVALQQESFSLALSLKKERKNSGTDVRTFPFYFQLLSVIMHLLSVDRVKHLGVNQCLVTRDQSARSDPPTFGTIDKSQLCGLDY